jgi:hypothetical protein
MMPPGAEPAGDLAPIAPLKPPNQRFKLSVYGRARFILVGSATHIVEFGGGLIMLMWGLWLVLPIHVFTADPLLYRVMAELAPEWIWGLVGVVVGAGTVWVLLTDGRDGRARMALLHFIIWLFVCLFIGQSSGFRSTAVPIYGMLSLGAGWVYVRLERDKRRPG